MHLYSLLASQRWCTKIRKHYLPPPQRTISTGGIRRSRTALLFPGQGAQYVGMGKDIYDAFPNSARLVIDEADDELEGSLKKLMFEGEQDELTLTRNAQPAILTTSLAILKVLECEYGFDVGKSCKYALGHSLGEYTALVATKSLSLRDAVRLVRLRGEAMQKTVEQLANPVSMSALIVRGKQIAEIEREIEAARKELPEGEVAELANVNSTFQVVISGTSRGVDILSQILHQRQFGARAVDLPVSAPFHCSLMKPAADAMEYALRSVRFSLPVVEVISNVDAMPYTHATDIAGNLFQQITRTVQWQHSIEYCKQNGINEFVAFGPGRVLSNLVKKQYPLDRVHSVATVADIEAQAKDFQKIIDEEEDGVELKENGKL
ncbi:uncharacterized protein VTP21DRAFT_6018 [Calcarisporiella thermophila]|uniref:uncharacterized protein n=1 Tax=Calcarisporiella thermophila TaxID=911321 RepID=UPI0037444D17